MAIRLQVLKRVELQLLEVSLVEYELEVAPEVVNAFLRVALLGLRVRLLGGTG